MISIIYCNITVDLITKNNDFKRKIRSWGHMYLPIDRTPAPASGANKWLVIAAPRTQWAHCVAVGTSATSCTSYTTTNSSFTTMCSSIITANISYNIRVTYIITNN